MINPSVYLSGSRANSCNKNGSIKTINNLHAELALLLECYSIVHCYHTLTKLGLRCVVVFREKYRRLLVMVYQVTVIRPLLAFIAAVLWVDGQYVPGRVSIRYVSESVYACVCVCVCVCIT